MEQDQTEPSTSPVPETNSRPKATRKERKKKKQRQRKDSSHIPVVKNQKWWDLKYVAKCSYWYSFSKEELLGALQNSGVKTNEKSKRKLIELITGEKIEKPPTKELIKEIHEYLERNKWKSPPSDVNLPLTPFDSSKVGFKCSATTPMDFLNSLGLKRWIEILVPELNEIFKKPRKRHYSATKTGQERVKLLKYALGKFNGRAKIYQTSPAKLKAFFAIWIEMAINDSKDVERNWGGRTKQRKSKQTSETQEQVFKKVGIIYTTTSTTFSSSDPSTPSKAGTLFTTASPTNSSNSIAPGSSSRPFPTHSSSSPYHDSNALLDKMLAGVRKKGNEFITSLMAREEWRRTFVALSKLDEKVMDKLEDAFNQCTKEIYVPDRYLSVDELTWGYKGRSRHRRYNPKKPNKWHLLFYAMIDSAKFCFQIHFAKSKFKAYKRTNNIPNDTTIQSSTTAPSSSVPLFTTPSPSISPSTSITAQDPSVTSSFPTSPLAPPPTLHINNPSIINDSSTPINFNNASTNPTAASSLKVKLYQYNREKWMETKSIAQIEKRAIEIMGMTKEQLEEVKKKKNLTKWTRKYQILDSLEDMLGIDGEGVKRKAVECIDVERPKKKRKTFATTTADLKQGEINYELKPEGAVIKIIRSLIKELPPIGSYVIAMDNYYGSVDSARLVKKYGHHIVATVRNNRPSYLYSDILGDVKKGKKKNKKPGVQKNSSEDDTDSEENEDELKIQDEPEGSEIDINNATDVVDPEIHPVKELTDDIYKNQPSKCRVYALEGSDDPTFAVSFNQDEGLIAYRWQDRATVNLISDFGSIQVRKHQRAESRTSNKKIHIWKPTIFDCYTKGMGYCDVFDKYASHNKFSQRASVWTIAKFAAMLKYMILNAYSLTCTTKLITIQGESPAHKTFLEALKICLIEDLKNERVKEAIVKKNEETNRATRKQTRWREQKKT